MKTENLQKVHSGNKLLTGEIGERESRERESREREDKEYKTHLARISSAGQGLCNTWAISPGKSVAAITSTTVFKLDGFPTPGD